MARGVAIAPLLAVVFTLGCSTLGDGDAGGGAANLPNRGVNGYRFVVDVVDASEVTDAEGPATPPVRRASSTSRRVGAAVS